MYGNRNADTLGLERNSDRDIVLLVRNARAIIANEHGYYNEWQIGHAKRDLPRFTADCERRGINPDTFDTTPAGA